MIDTVTIAEPFSEPFHHVNGSLTVHRSIYRNTVFTKEPLQNHLSVPQMFQMRFYGSSDKAVHTLNVNNFAQNNTGQS